MRRQAAGPLLAALLAALLATPARADPGLAALAPFLDAVAACTGRTDLALTVVGVEPGQTALSREQAEEVRLAAETRLQGTGRVRLAAAAAAADAEARLLPSAEVLDLLERIRQVPGVTEATARIAVR